MSPRTTGIAVPAGLARRWATISGDASMPSTVRPRAASGRATRPVPTASSRTGPPSARSARNSTAGAGSGLPLSYVSAQSRPKSPGSSNMDTRPRLGELGEDLRLQILLLLERGRRADQDLDRPLASDNGVGHDRPGLQRAGVGVVDEAR